MFRWHRLHKSELGIFLPMLRDRSNLRAALRLLIIEVFLRACIATATSVQHYSS